MTRSEIRDLTRKRLGETTSAFWTDAEVNNYINYAHHPYTQTEILNYGVNGVDFAKQ